MYDHAARIPLIVTWPERWPGGQRRAGACSLVDVVRTIADLGGAEVPGDWDGDSLAGWLDDPSATWKDVAVSEYYAHNIASGFAMLRHGPYKYVYHTRMNRRYGPERELYHLEDDPGEFSNLAGRSEQAARVAKMHRMLVQELGREPDEIEQICRADYARGYDRI
jgi:choline-sulfatase